MHSAVDVCCQYNAAPSCHNWCRFFSRIYLDWAVSEELDDQWQSWNSSRTDICEIEALPPSISESKSSLLSRVDGRYEWLNIVPTSELLRFHLRGDVWLAHICISNGDHWQNIIGPIAAQELSFSSLLGRHDSDWQVCKCRRKRSYIAWYQLMLILVPHIRPWKFHIANLEFWAERDF